MSGGAPFPRKAFAPPVQAYPDRMTVTPDPATSPSGHPSSALPDQPGQASSGRTDLQLGYSFCPNDTFIFYALSHGRTPSPLPVTEVLEDVQTLNDWAGEARLPITKISYRAYFSVMRDYVALRSGGALGRGVGPLIVARTDLGDLNGLTVASPGALTTAELLLRIVYPGVNVVRMNFSHGSHDDHRATYTMVRELAAKKGLTIGILQDLQGPKIRTARFTNGSATLQKGQNFIITMDDVEGDETRVGSTYKGLAGDVYPGMDLLLDDGNMALRVESVKGNDIHTTVVVGGVLKNNKGINVPQAELSVPAMSDKDVEDMAFGAELGVDWVALSFVRSRDDLLLARHYLSRYGSKAKLMAKIEKPQAVDRFEDILKEVDGIMVARGDLGVEMRAEQVPGVGFEQVPPDDAAALAVYHFAEDRPFASQFTAWAPSLEWALEHHREGRLSRRALAGFIISQLAPFPAATRDRTAFRALTQALWATGPNVYELMRYLKLWAIPAPWRRDLKRVALNLRRAVSRRSPSTPSPRSRFTPR